MTSRAVEHARPRLAFVGVVGVILGAGVTGGFNYLAHQGDLDAKMIELSVGILRSEPTTGTAPLREWAIDVIDKRARFSFNATQRAVLLNQQLPFKGGAFSYDYSYDFFPGYRSDREILKNPLLLPKTQPPQR